MDMNEKGDKTSQRLFQERLAVAVVVVVEKIHFGAHSAKRRD
jgi:hypothetical protein